MGDYPVPDKINDGIRNLLLRITVKKGLTILSSHITFAHQLSNKRAYRQFVTVLFEKCYREFEDLKRQLLSSSVAAQRLKEKLMTKSVKLALTSVILTFGTTNLFSQSEAGAPFLLIAPGARASAMGEANVAIAEDAVGGFYNPAGIAWSEGRELSFMRSKWLPGLVDDISYNFLGYRQYIEGLGSVGGHLIYMDLGEQIQTGENSPDEIGRFQSFMLAIAGTYGADLSESSTIGVTMKFVHQNLAPFGAGREQGKGTSSSFAFDVGYLGRDKMLQGLDIGVAIANIGPNIQFIDANQADPMPMNLKVGIAYLIFDGEFNSLQFVYDMNKQLVASYPDRDLDNNGIKGEISVRGEEAHKDSFYRGIITSWTDDSSELEWQEIIHNVGIEYWYSGLVALRAGFFRDYYLRDEEDNVALMKTLGIGIKYGNYGFDFGYVDGPKGHPIANTMRFSLNLSF